MTPLTLNHLLCTLRLMHLTRQFKIVVCILFPLVMPKGHSVPETMIELWGSEKKVDPAPMSGFLKNEAHKSGREKANIVMRSFNSTTLPVRVISIETDIQILSSLAMEYTLFDQYYSSLPGPTLPNRMYFLAATSHGACINQAMVCALWRKILPVFSPKLRGTRNVLSLKTLMTMECLSKFILVISLLALAFPASVNSQGTFMCVLISSALRPRL